MRPPLFFSPLLNNSSTFELCYTSINMSLLLLVGIVLAGVPASLIIGFAAYIFIGFVTDDKDAKSIFTLALIIMGIGVVLILAHVAGTVIQFT